MKEIFRKQRPIHLTFFVTRRCNAGCPFCFYLRTAEKTPDVRPELSLEEISRTSSSLGSLLWLAFSGGEIYLRDDLVDISGIFYKNNKPVIMLFPTNGLLPEVILDRTEKILSNCPKSVIAVKLSLDGVGRAHDALRNSPGSFDKAMQTYHMLEGLMERYRNFELGINTVFCSENQDSMDKIIDFVTGLKNIKAHTISLIRGNLANDNYKRVDYRKYNKAIARLEENLKKNISGVYRFRGARVKAAQDIVQRRLIYQTACEQKRSIPCYAGRLNLVLRESGDVYPCELLEGSFGNVRNSDYDIRSILRSEKAGKIIDEIRASHCHCTHECYTMTNILFNPKVYPTLAKEYLQLKR
jgi:MoaA/NifB/PqqE/SkfB family radical SAM enzyme